MSQVTTCGSLIGIRYARLERLFLKLFLEEEDLHLYLLLDNSRSMGFGEPTKLEYAKRLAAALGFIGLVRSDRVKIETLNQAAQAIRMRAPWTSQLVANAQHS